MRHRQHHTGTDRHVRSDGGRPPEVRDLPFDELLSLLAGGVAEAQERLDAEAVAAARSLTETTVDVVPRVTRTIDAGGTVSTTTAPAEERTLLELGFEPTRYRFEEATVEVDVDAAFVDEGGSALRASTTDASTRRRVRGEVETNARLSARLRPTPLPPRTGPATGEADGPIDDRTDGGIDAD